MLIELCESNELALFYTELERMGFDVIPYPCLDRCDACAVSAYAFADGELIEAEDAATLLQRLQGLDRKSGQPANDPW